MGLRCGVLGIACVLAACTCSQPSAPVATKAAAAEPAPSAAPPAAGPTASDDAPAIPTLTEEDQRLIAADPKDLTVEERRKRAFALRRKIMQNPDSPAALMLEDLRKAHGSGELEVPKPGEGPRFEARGTAPTGGAPPAGVRRPPAGTSTPETPASGAP